MRQARFKTELKSTATKAYVSIYVRNYPSFTERFARNCWDTRWDEAKVLTDRRLIESMMGDLQNAEPLSTIATRIVLSSQFRMKRGASETTSHEGHINGDR